MILRTSLIIVLGCYISDSQSQSLTPGRRVDPEMFYHNALRKIVLLDGTPPFFEQPDHSEVWTWDGRSWSKLKTPVGPSSRYMGAADYDTERNVIVSFGGRVGKNEKVSRDIWEWDGKEWHDVTDTSASARDHHSLVYDEDKKRMVLFGGGKFPRVEGPWEASTMSWDGRSWSLLANEGPLGRVSTMVYDSKRKCITLFGGIGAPDENGIQPNYNDTWSWDGKRWNMLSDKGPPGRARHAMVYDRRAGTVLLYGGERNNSEDLGDMWTWDGKTWREIILTEPNPGTRRVHAMAYDEARGITVLYGGMKGKELMTDTWEWNGKYWKEIK